MPDKKCTKGFLLITARNILRIEILTEQFPTEQDAYHCMKEKLRERILIDDKENADNMIAMMEDGITFSNMAMDAGNAHIYQDCAATWHFWKIIEIQ